MKLTTLFRAGLGVGLAPVAAAGVASAQEAGTDTVRTSYVSFTAGSISGADYSYSVEDVFPVEAEVGDGYIIEAAYGMHFQDNWRGEVAFTWRDHNNATTTWQFGANLTGPGMSAYTLDAIGYHDFRMSSRANAYLGAGIGLASVTVDDGVIVDSTGLGLHLQAIAGVEALVSDRVKVFAEARLRSMRPSIEAGTAGAAGEVDDSFDITSTSVQAGFKILL